MPRPDALLLARDGDSPGTDWTMVQSRLIGYLRARGARADLAEDIAQETVLRLIAISRTKEIGSVFALGFRIADNLLVDQHRAESRYADAGQGGDDHEGQWQNAAPSLERVLDSRRAIEVFQRCLNRMPALRREVLVRRRLRNESCRAIGEDLALSSKAVEKHITRGLVDLRRAMEKAGIDPAGWNE
ncbi:RNA polymerase sigma factor [Novosphingobium profundi]|uniref:RNA polymerase sigma factor n=1 Tax=Novosphingobium profundi TaxID=1774954 RepID=UPI001CFCC614|nr:RNA polymerase sigma factor [Novosphingobium profundi]